MADMDNEEVMDDDEEVVEEIPQHGFKTIFQMMNQGDKTLRDFHQFQILLVGLSRVGKSTLINWLLKRPMIGKDNGRGQVSYINVGLENANVVQGMISATLIANKGLLDNIDILDMAGYGDTRDHISVFGVSYCLQKVLSLGSRFKFILVIGEEAFRAGGRNDVSRTFHSFLAMFRFKDMPAEVKKALFDSVALIVTRANDIYSRQKIIESFLEQIISPASHILNKELIYELLNTIYKQNKIYDFPLAQPNLECPPCNAINALNERNWTYFDLKQFDIEKPHPRGSYVLLPFKKEFQKISKKQKKAFQKVIDEKIKSFSKFKQIIVQFIKTAIRSQYEQQINYQPCFQLVQKFLQKHDHYKSVNQIQQTDLSNIPTIKKNIELNRLIRQLLNIYQNVRQKKYQETSKFYMENYLYQIYKQIIGLILSTVCEDTLKQRLILRIKYVVLRGFTELTTISDIDKLKGSDAYTAIYDSLQDLEIENTSLESQNINDNETTTLQKDNVVNQIYENFFLQIMPHLKKPSYNNIVFKIKLDSYSDEFSQEMKEFKRPKEFRRFKYELKKQICLDYKKNANYQLAIKYGFAGGQQLQKDLEERINSSGLTNQELANTQQFNKDCLKIKEIYHQIVVCLLRGKLNVQLALKICLYMNNVSGAMEVYKQMFYKEQDADDQVKMKACLQQYAQYCAVHGFIEKAQTLLMKRKDIEFESLEEVDRIIEKMNQIQYREVDLKAQARENFSNKTLLKLSDSVMNAIVQQLQDLIDNPPSNVTTIISEQSK